MVAPIHPTKQIVISEDAARGGVVGHNVRYVLFMERARLQKPGFTLTERDGSAKTRSAGGWNPPTFGHG